MNRRRWLLSVAIALGFMLADVIALVGVTRHFLPHKPPQWATGIFFWVLAWPVPFLGRLFPNTAGGSDHRPSLIVVGAAGLIDLILLTLIADRLRGRSSRNRQQLE